MSDKLGTIPFPQVGGQPDQPQTSPLEKYFRQLDPLARVADPLWQTPRAPGLAPIQSPLGEPSLSRLGMRALTPQGPQPGVQTPPQSPLAPAAPAAPASAGLAAAAPTAPSAAPTAAPLGGSAALAGGGDAGDVTQYSRSPTTGGLIRPAQGGASALAAMAPEAGGQATAQTEQVTPGGGVGGGVSGGPHQIRSREEDTVNTALASETKTRNPHLGADQRVGLEMAKAATPRPGEPSFHQKAADTIKERFGDQIDFKGATTADEITERFVNHMRDNLLDLWNRVPGTWKDRAKLWYVGANKIAHNWANEYGYSPRQMAGVIAALSPATDWFKNVGLAKRVIEYVRDHQNTMTNDKLLAVGQKFTDNQKVQKVRENMQQMLDGMRGKTFGQLTDDKQRALWIRWHDTANGDRTFKGISPEGDILDTVRNKPSAAQKRRGELGNPATGGFLYTDPIRKALAILQKDDVEHISRNLGNQHKVRSFYNNIIAPFSRAGHVTIDTHAIAAAMGQPLGQSHPTVELGLGGTGPQSAEGLNGLYPYVAEAYRRAAKRVSTKDAEVLPREFQSVTWEGIRGMFSAAFKNQEKNVKDNLAFWNRHAAGKASAQATRNNVYAAAEAPINAAGHREPRPPSWHTGEASVEE